MKKRIFEEQMVDEAVQYEPKREFSEAKISIEQEMSPDEIEMFATQHLKPPRFWIRILMIALILFVIAAVAQSVEWVITSWLSHQWIALLFALAMLGVSFVGIGVIISEWRKLVWLRQHHYAQQMSQQFLWDTNSTSGQSASEFCQKVINTLPHNTSTQQSIMHWQQQMNEGYNAQEVMFLFSQNVLAPIDERVKTMLTKSATENALLVAISPLAVVDMLMIAWRNIVLINKISRAYGLQLGYFSRLRLLKMVLTNMVFSGVTEMATDMGTSFFSHSLASQISLRAGQGIAVGLLTARLGLKAMEFCRPIAFTQSERPTLSGVSTLLLDVVKTTLFNTVDKREKVQR